MRLAALLSFVLLPYAAMAQASLCIPDAAAAVVQQGGRFVGAPADPNQRKFIVKNVGGRWQVTEHSSGSVLFDKCSNENFCERSDGFAGAFMRDSKGVFTVFLIAGTTEATMAPVVARGRCSAL